MLINELKREKLAEAGANGHLLIPVWERSGVGYSYTFGDPHTVTAPKQLQFIVPMVDIPADDEALNKWLFSGVGLSLPSWIPIEQPYLGDMFCGVPRHLDSARLAGIRVKRDGLTPRIAIETALKHIAREGGDADLIVSHPDVGSSITGNTFPGPRKHVRGITDKDCPINTIWLLQRDTWTIVESGPGRGTLVCRGAGRNGRVDL